MSIKYTLISKSGDKVLCEYSEYVGNFEQVSRNLLKKIKKDTRGTIVYEKEYFFHFINSDDLTYMCMSDEKYPKETAFVYLEEVKGDFLGKFSKKQIETATAYYLNDEFKYSLKSKVEYYNDNYESDAVTKLKKGVMELKDAVIEASEVLNQRGEKIQIVISKADALKTESKSYFEGAKKVRKSATRKKTILTIIIIVVVIVIAWLISSFVCGFNYAKCKSKSTEKNTTTSTTTSSGTPPPKPSSDNSTTNGSNSTNHNPPPKNDNPSSNSSTNDPKSANNQKEISNDNGNVVLSKNKTTVETTSNGTQIKTEITETETIKNEKDSQVKSSTDSKNGNEISSQNKTLVNNNNISNSTISNSGETKNDNNQLNNTKPQTLNDQQVANSDKANPNPKFITKRY